MKEFDASDISMWRQNYHLYVLGSEHRPGHQSLMPKAHLGTKLQCPGALAGAQRHPFYLLVQIFHAIFHAVGEEAFHQQKLHVKILLKKHASATGV